MTAVLKPGDTIGILGDEFSSTQLINCARDAGLRIVTYSTKSNSQIRRQADVALVGGWDDRDQLRRFGEACQVVTYVSDELSAAMVDYLRQFTIVPQGNDLLSIVQDRGLQHAFFDQLNVNSVPYETVVDEHDMQVAAASLGFPAVLKPIVRMTRTDPFFILHQSSDIQLASQYFQAGSFVMESVVPFQQSLAVIATKDQQGEIQQFPPVVIKTFAQGQRTIYTVMDDVEAELVAEMQRITKEIGQHVDYVGTYEINFGYTATGTLYVCGVETTVSNTGYLFDLAMNINEYRQHLRAISGLPISPVKKYRDVIMQTFTRRQVPLVLELREQHPDWQFIFSYRQAALSNSYSGCLLIQTADLQQAMAELEASGLGPQTAGKN